jgi:hypothetical protein
MKVEHVAEEMLRLWAQWDFQPFMMIKCWEATIVLSMDDQQ